MNEEEDELLFLSKLYKTWPWCYDREAIIELRGKIINLQHRKLAKVAREKDLIRTHFSLVRKKKNKKKSKKSIKKEFAQERIATELTEPHNVE